MKEPTEINAHCSVARSLTVLGEKWTLLVVRDVRLGHTRFADLRSRLGVAPDVLADRLAKLVDFGVLERRAYREEGSREREEYVLTPAGDELAPVLGALNQWGEAHHPLEGGSRTRWVSAESGRPVRVAFVDDDGREVALEDVESVR
jgi:DNA-binding HxlR family transcriptional regulator